MHFTKDSTTINTAAATVRQLVSVVFERVMASPDSRVSNGAQFVFNFSPTRTDYCKLVYYSYIIRTWANASGPGNVHSAPCCLQLSVRILVRGRTTRWRVVPRARPHASRSNDAPSNRCKKVVNNMLKRKARRVGRPHRGGIRKKAKSFANAHPATNSASSSPRPSCSSGRSSSTSSSPSSSIRSSTGMG